MPNIDYDRINWQNIPSPNTALEADNLNKMDKAIYDIVNYVNKASEFILSSSAWVTTSNEQYPYKLAIASSNYSDSDYPICQVWGVNEIETEDESLCITYIKKVIVNSLGVIVYASTQPTVDLKLVLKV